MTLTEFLVRIADQFDATGDRAEALRCRDYACIAAQLEEEARLARVPAWLSLRKLRTPKPRKAA